MRTTLLIAVLTLGAPALAEDDLNPEKAAKIDRDQKKANDAIDKKYGNKKSSELSRDERKAITQERAAAEREVLEKNNVDAKAYTIYTAKMNREDRAATKAAGERLEAKEKAEAAEAEKKKGGPKEITIQRGGQGNPIVMEEAEGAPPMVEQGLPDDAQDDQNAAAGAGTGDNEPTADKAPAKKKKKK